MTDKELLKKLKKNKSSGLSAVIDLYSGLLYKIAAGIILPLGTKEDVEECVSDSFLAFYGEIDKIDLEKASIKAYLAVITKRRAIDFYRRLKRASELISDEAAESIPSVAEDFTLTEERKSAVFSALSKLEEPDKTIVIRRFYLGETAAETGRVLGMSEGAVQKRLERSKSKLKAELGGVFYG